MDVNIHYQDRLDLIEPSYPGDCSKNQMEIWLEIDWERKEITAYTRGFRICGTPARIYHGLADVYRLPGNVDASGLKEWVEEEVIPRIKQLETAFESYWDGSNWRGRWKDNEFVVTLYDDLNDFMDAELAGYGSIPRIMDGGGVWDVYDWISTTPEELTATSSDEEIESMAKELISEANCQDIVLRGDVIEYLKTLREFLQVEEDNE